MARQVEDSSTSNDDGSENKEVGMGEGWDRICGSRQAMQEKATEEPAEGIRIFYRKEKVGIVCSRAEAAAAAPREQ